MKITKISYENFRNFRDPDSIDFSTDGKVTIIYGVNGAGKTTFHQLFQWIIYGTVHFNKTSSDKLYNLDYESKLENNRQFSVKGSIDFEHEGISYLMSREWTYRKTAFETSVLKKTFTINKKTETNDWIRVANPEEFIESILPSGLSDYFFFDGESMIADLKIKGKESAKSLKEALYMILDLSIYDKAVRVIGSEEQKTTVLGLLFLSKTDCGSNKDLIDAGNQMVIAQNTRDAFEEKIKAIEETINSDEELVKKISEQIGGAKSQSEYEKMRKMHQTQRDLYILNASREYEDFGEEMNQTFPRLFLAAAVENAKQIIMNQSSNSKKIINGLTKELIDALLKEERCICGNPLSQKEKAYLSEFYKSLPPYGYESLYTNFKAISANWGKLYDRQKIEGYIERAADDLEKARKEDEEIQKIDEKIKENKQFDELVDKRIAAENEIKELRKTQNELFGELSKAKLLVKKHEKRIKELSENEANNKLIDRKISIMKSVKDFYESELQEKSNTYSKCLQKNIQELINKMLEAKRSVEVSSDFALRVFDEHNDEAKSEGQFATISFAYIGGIFQLLKEENMITNKEYPLVLDAPFSKLGDLPRQKVIDTIPEYAPQIILFSKDNLQDCFDSNNIGRVYTITSNISQNISKIERGFLWK